MVGAHFLKSSMKEVLDMIKTTHEDIEDFLAQKRLALVGVSRKTSAAGCSVTCAGAVTTWFR